MVSFVTCWLFGSNDDKRLADANQSPIRLCNVFGYKFNFDVSFIAYRRQLACLLATVVGGIEKQFPSF